jgi:hypothetical protein
MTNLFNKTTPEAKSNEQGTTNSGRVKTGIVASYIEEIGKPQHGAVLINLEKSLPFKKHEFTSKGSQICFKSPYLFFDPEAGETPPDCPWCKEKDRFDKAGKKLNRAKDCLGIVMHIFDRVGQVKEFEKDNGEKVTYDVNPVCVMDFKRGPEDVNLKELINFDEQGLLDSPDDNVWEMEKYHKDLKKAVSITSVGDSKVKLKPILAKFKNLPDGVKVAPEIFERFKAMTPSEVRGIIFNAYVSDPKMWDLVDKNLVVKPQPISKEEKVETDVETSSEFESDIEE